jgi:hypothetical protein
LAPLEDLDDNLDLDDSKDPSEAKRQKRMRRNRESAAMSRERKSQMLATCSVAARTVELVDTSHRKRSACRGRLISSSIGPRRVRAAATRFCLLLCS